MGDKSADGKAFLKGAGMAALKAAAKVAKKDDSLVALMGVLTVDMWDIWLADKKVSL